MAMTGQLVRCPKCISAQRGAVAPDPNAGPQSGGTIITLDPERNVCTNPRCGHVFSAAEAKIEDYAGHGNYAGRHRRQATSITKNKTQGALFGAKQ